MDDQHGFGLGELANAGALLYTADGGNTWQDIYSFPSEFSPSMLSFVDSQRGWVLATSVKSGATVILNTTDGGLTWTPCAKKVESGWIYYNVSGAGYSDN